MKLNESEVEDFIKEQTEDILWEIHGTSKCELKDRKLVRTSNIVGERGEQIAIDFYCNTPNFPKLQAAPESTQNIDAISINGERYSIKAVTEPSKTTGVFYGLPIDKNLISEKRFEYLIIVILDKKFKPRKILECDWNTFIKHIRLNSRMKAWNISITRKFEEDSKIIFEANE